MTVGPTRPIFASFPVAKYLHPAEKRGRLSEWIVDATYWDCFWRPSPGASAEGRGSIPRASMSLRRSPRVGRPRQHGRRPLRPQRAVGRCGKRCCLPARRDHSRWIDTGRNAWPGNRRAPSRCAAADRGDQISIVHPYSSVGHASRCAAADREKCLAPAHRRDQAGGRGSRLRPRSGRGRRKGRVRDHALEPRHGDASVSADQGSTRSRFAARSG